MIACKISSIVEMLLQATKGANEAKQNAVDSKRQVNRVLSQLQDILDQLSKLILDFSKEALLLQVLNETIFYCPVSIDFEICMQLA